MHGQVPPVAPDAITFTTAIRACIAGGEAGEGLALVAAAKARAKAEEEAQQAEPAGIALDARFYKVSIGHTDENFRK
jgi:hypothetical protein